MENFKLSLQNFADTYVPYVHSEYQIHFLVASTCLALLFMKMIIKIVLKFVVSADKWSSKHATQPGDSGDTFTITPQPDDEESLEEKWLGTKQLSALLSVHKNTTSGLVGILVKGPVATIVEVNCTNEQLVFDKTFQKVVHNLAYACTEYTYKISVYRNAPTINKVYWAAEQLEDFQYVDGKDLIKELSKKGECISLRRAFSFRLGKGITPYGYTYPRRFIKGGTYTGKFGAIVALRSGKGESDVLELGRRLCQQIICNNPIKIKSSQFMSTQAEEECCLLSQKYMHDESMKVEAVVKELDVEVMDFKRFICGELDSTNEVPL